MTPATATDQLESFSPFDGSRLGAVPTLAPDEVQADQRVLLRIGQLAQTSVGNRTWIRWPSRRSPIVAT